MPAVQRIFPDANIQFSAARADGAVRTLLGLLVERQHILVASPGVLIEARRILERKAKPDALVELQRIESTLDVSIREQGSGFAVHIAWLPEKDRHVLAAAIDLRCNVLITGDKTHFGAGYGQRLHGVLIVSPRMAAETPL